MTGRAEATTDLISTFVGVRTDPGHVLKCCHPISEGHLCFPPVQQQSNAHTDDGASLNNSHGGLPSTTSASSSELNHQVEAFRGQMTPPPSPPPPNV